MQILVTYQCTETAWFRWLLTRIMTMSPSVTLMRGPGYRPLIKISSRLKLAMDQLPQRS